MGSGIIVTLPIIAHVPRLEGATNGGQCRQSHQARVIETTKINGASHVAQRRKLDCFKLDVLECDTTSYVAQRRELSRFGVDAREIYIARDIHQQWERQYRSGRVDIRHVQVLSDHDEIWQAHGRDTGREGVQPQIARDRDEIAGIVLRDSVAQQHT